MLTPLLLSLISSASAANIADLAEGDLVISEIMSNPAAVSYYRGQWFEIYNNTSEEVDLNGLEVADASGTAFTVSSSVLVGAGEYALFAVRSTSSSNGGLPTVDYRYTTALMTLNTVSDTLILRSGTTTFDSVTYDVDAGYPGEAGSSFSVDPTGLASGDNDSSTDWCLSTSTYGDGDFGTPGAANDACPVGPDSLLTGELLITEVMDTPAAVNNNKGEYFEVYNNSTLTADLDGLLVTSTGGDAFIVSESVTLRPGEYALFAARSNSTLNGGLPTVDARYIYSTEINLTRNDNLTLSNGIDDFDSVSWNTSDYPTAAGVAKNLSTASFDEADNDDSTTWCASLTTYGSGDYGTPRAANSDCDADTDGDGFEEGEDCDDTNSAINPDADELCDGVDNDCDGDIDEDGATDAATWYADTDNDKFGDPASSVVACERPLAYRANNEDCDDTDAAVGNAGTMYADADGDGYGTPDSTAVVCAGEAGYSSSDADCDDTDSDISPDAEEICADGIDSDCDGHDTNDCDQSLATADAALYGVSASEAAGFSLTATDVNGDGFDDILVGARLNSDSGTYAGKSYLVLGPVSGSLDLSEADAAYIGESAEDLSGVSLSGGDLDGDGFSDLVIGASQDDDAATDAGAAYIIYGAATVTPGDVALSGALKLTGEVDSDKAGRSVAVIGDVNNDGAADLLVGAPEYDTTSLVNAGAAYLLYGPATASDSLSIADAIFEGAAAQDYTGYTVAPAGDTDADGVPDLLIGAYRADPTSFNEGSAYLVSGALTGTVSLSTTTAIARFDGESSSDQASEGAIWGAGDVNGDGFDDVIIGAQRNDPSSMTDAGAAYLVYGPFSGATPLSGADAIFTGISAADNAGRSVNGGFDYDQDGLADIVIGSKKDNTAAASAGAAYLYFGPATGTTSLSTADVSFLGASAGDEAGIVVRSGDVNGDGLPDILVGAHQESTGAAAGGAAYLLLNGN